jgi:hypothetical protein
MAAFGASIKRALPFTSTDIHEASFPRLASVISRGFTHAVALHGFDDPEAPTDGIVIGGSAWSVIANAVADVHAARLRASSPS